MAPVYAEEPIEEPPLPAETAIDDVTIRPVVQRPTFFEPILGEPRREEVAEDTTRPFIPPRPEMPPRAPRMPRIDELPLPAQKEIRATREPAAPHPVERKRMTLLQRLANVGMGRREEDEPPMPRPAPRPTETEPRPAAERRHPEQVSEYARRPAARSLPLDLHGRAPGRPAEDDELEIPAFLRRQAN
jgi:cell division protein FtsZ